MAEEMLEIPAWAAELHRFVSEDKYRPGIHQVVHFERVDAGRVAAVATNGHICVHATWWDDAFAKRLVDGPLEIDSEALRILCGLAPPGVWVVLYGRDLRCGNAAVLDVVRDVKFPEWRSVIQAPHKSPTGWFGIDVRYIDRLAKYAERVGSGAFCLTLVAPDDPRGIIRFDILCEDAVVGVALMPMLVDPPRAEAAPRG